MPARQDFGGGQYPHYEPTEDVRLCPYCMEGEVHIDLETMEGDCPECGRNVTFDGGVEECVHCGRKLGPDSFEDGLRCKFCQEADEEAESELS